MGKAASQTLLGDGTKKIPTWDFSKLEQRVQIRNRYCVSN